VEKVDVVAKKFELAFKKGCENQGQCENLEFVQIGLIL